MGMFTEQRLPRMMRAPKTKEGADGSSRTPGIEPMDTMGDMVVPASKSDRAAMAKKYFSDYLVAPGVQLQRMMVTLPIAALSATKGVMLWLVQFSRELAADPRTTLGEGWAHFKEEMAHYWVGTKLLWADSKIAFTILGRALQGSRLSRRERNQLVRTSTDLFRLVPFALFVVIPFMEVLLPVALKVFPSMLPSTFEQSMAKEEAMKRELKMRIAMAGFMNDMLREMAKDVSQSVCWLVISWSTDAPSDASSLIPIPPTNSFAHASNTRFTRGDQ